MLQFSPHRHRQTRSNVFAAAAAITTQSLPRRSNSQQFDTTFLFAANRCCENEKRSKRPVASFTHEFSVISQQRFCHENACRSTKMPRQREPQHKHYAATCFATHCCCYFCFRSKSVTKMSYATCICCDLGSRSKNPVSRLLNMTMRSVVYRRLGCDAPEAMRQLHAERHQACGTAAAAPPAPR